jgi:hypothetical protein
VRTVFNFLGPIAVAISQIFFGKYLTNLHVVFIFVLTCVDRPGIFLPFSCVLIVVLAK